MPVRLRQKADEISNTLREGAEEGVSIATGLKLARELYKKAQQGKVPKKRNPPKDKP